MPIVRITSALGTAPSGDLSSKPRDIALVQLGRSNLDEVGIHCRALVADLLLPSPYRTPESALARAERERTRPRAAAAAATMTPGLE